MNQMQAELWLVLSRNMVAHQEWWAGLAGQVQQVEAQYHSINHSIMSSNQAQINLEAQIHELQN